MTSLFKLRLILGTSVIVPGPRHIHNTGLTSESDYSNAVQATHGVPNMTTMIFYGTFWSIEIFFGIEDFIEINKRQQTHHTHTKYTIYIE